jgi:hypothetical protein
MRLHAHEVVRACGVVHTRWHRWAAARVGTHRMVVQVGWHMRMAEHTGGRTREGLQGICALDEHEGGCAQGENSP